MPAEDSHRRPQLRASRERGRQATGPVFTGSSPQETKTTSASAERTQVEFRSLQVHPEHFKMVTGRGSHAPAWDECCSLVGVGTVPHVSVSLRLRGLPDCTFPVAHLKHVHTLLPLEEALEGEFAF